MRILAALVLGWGCGAEAEPPPGALEIGERDGADGFRPYEDGEPAPLLMNTNGGVDVIPLRLRALGTEAPDLEAEVTVTVDGWLFGAAPLAAQPDTQPAGGEGLVLRDVNVAFQARSCCYVCREGLFVAQLTGAGGERFEGSARLLLARGECPDETVCCPVAEDCPDPQMTQVCE